MPNHLYPTKGLDSPPGGYFGYLNPISCLNVSHLQLLIIGGGAGLLISSWGWIIDGGTRPYNY
ncbi:hypothetical protein NIES39_O02760 [Arthrospira platensis NIES-39]|nr:hypothetical protein NIES39_O02760 [Arthrospira platensis NIES-39]